MVWVQPVLGGVCIHLRTLSTMRVLHCKLSDAAGGAEFIGGGGYGAQSSSDSSLE